MINAQQSITKRVTPRPLVHGDKIALVRRQDLLVISIDEATSLVEAAGFTPVMHEELSAKSGQFGGDDEHRAEVVFFI